MESRKDELLQRVESDRDVLIDFLRQFIRCPSPGLASRTSPASRSIAWHPPRSTPWPSMSPAGRCRLR